MKIPSAFAILAFATMAFTPFPKKVTHPFKQTNKGWTPLFDGKTTGGWHTFGKTTAGEAWKVANGELYLDGAYKAAHKGEGGGDIVSESSFENFHLKLEWKISKNGNSGVIFWVQDDPVKYEYVWHTGPEMQVLDNDGHPDGKIIKHRAGNLYDLVEGKEGAVKPVGEWNLSEIICNKGKLDFFLNGVNVVSTKYGDENWKQMIAGSKFKIRPDFAVKFNGHIALQDHGNDVWFKNIEIKKL
ncbi:MAG: hypothetical protein RLZZ28_52 [Bacteroidota bacterium]|jgi:hypothetical protein